MCEEKKEGYVSTDGMLEVLEAGWTASFPMKIYHHFPRYLIREFLKAVTEWSIGMILGLFRTFGADIFRRDLLCCQRKEYIICV